MVSFRQFCTRINANHMKPIREIKYINLRRYFYIKSEERPITYKQFAEDLQERPDLMGKMLSGLYEIPDDKIVKWCGITGLPFSFFYDEHPTPPWPPEKRSYRMMQPDERLLLAAEDYVEYNPNAKRMEKMNQVLRLICEELIRVVPEETLAKSAILRHFVECFNRS